MNADWASLRARHPRIHVVVAPPRTRSTAFARVFWEHPSVGYYAHEPFESTYFDGRGLDDVVAKLASPTDLQALYKPGAAGRDLVIKEMPYQVGPHAPLLFRLATGPVVFLLSHPRRSVLSRMRKKLEVGDSPRFPLRETGWTLLAEQIGWCEAHGVPFLLVHAADFSNAPQRVFSAVFDALGLAFDAAQLRWRAASHVALDNLGGRHDHLYEKVLASDGLLPMPEAVPGWAAFPEDLHPHLRECEAIYDRLCAHPRRIHPSGGPDVRAR